MVRSKPRTVTSAGEEIILMLNWSIRPSQVTLAAGSLVCS